MPRILASLALVIAVFVPGVHAQEVFVGKTADGWVKQLRQSSDAGQRRSAAYALGKLGRNAISSLAAMKAALAAEKDAKVRDSLVFALGEICRLSDDARADRELEPLFVQFLKDENAYVRRSAAFAIGCVGRKSDAALAGLDGALADAEPMVRQNAAWALGQFGLPALPSLRKALSDTDSLVKRDAAGALLQMEDADAVHKLVPELHPLCRDPSSEVRRAALNVLVRVVDATDKGDAVAALRFALDDRDLENRRNAALALTNIGGTAALDAMPVLLSAARDSDVELRRQAVIAIRNIGPAAARAVPDLVRILTGDKDAEVRRNAALALGGIGKAAEPAVPTLLKRIQDLAEDTKVRVECEQALSEIGPVAAAVDIAPALLKILENTQDDIDVREKAVWALRVHGGNLRTMTGPLEAFTRILKERETNANKMLRYDCAYMLGMVWQFKAPDDALNVLSDFLGDPTIRLYRGTTIGTGGIASERKGGKADLKQQAEGDAREMAADALKAIGHARYAGRADIMKQLRSLAADPKTFPPLQKKAAALIQAAQ